MFLLVTVEKISTKLKRLENSDTMLIQKVAVLVAEMTKINQNKCAIDFQI